VGPPRAKEIRAAPANCFQLPCPKSTALQSDPAIIGKKADGCIDTHHKIGLLRSRICQLLNRPQSRSRVERAPDRYPDRCPDSLLSHCPATRTSFRAANHGIDAACECSLTTRLGILRRRPQCRLAVSKNLRTEAGTSSYSTQRRRSSSAMSKVTSRDQPSAILKATMRTGFSYCPPSKLRTSVAPASRQSKWAGPRVSALERRW
jgi:hypothetical protein